MKPLKRIPTFGLMILTTFLLGVLITKFEQRLIGRLHQPSPWEVLLSFENQHLENLDERSSRTLANAIQQMTGKPNPDEFKNRQTYRLYEFTPVLFQKISNTNKEKRYILVEESQMEMIPGESRLRVHVFDLNGVVLSSEAFSAGYRQYLTNVVIRHIDIVHEDTLAVDTEHVFTDHASHQYYVLIDNQVSLIRIESGMTLQRNDQAWPWTIGPTSLRTADEWEQVLFSKNHAEVLSALTWMSGRHPQLDNDDNLEAEKVAVLRSRDAVIQRLMTLINSDDLWIRDAAEAALNSKD